VSERRPGPPRVAEALLLRLLPGALAESIAGDLHEAHARVARERGARAAAAWYWLRVLTLRYSAVRRAARRGYATEPSRGAVVSGLWHDARCGLRGARTHPALSALVACTIALGVGAITVVYGVVDGVLLRPLPYPESGRIVQIWSTAEAWRDAENALLRSMAGSFPQSFPVFEDWRTGARSLASIGTYDRRHATVTGGDRPERAPVTYVTAGLFEVLAVDAALGRRIVPEDDRPGGAGVAVLSDGHWRRRYGGERSVLGRVLVVDDRAYTVVGVMPRGFYFPSPEYDLWLTFPDEMRARDRGTQFLETIARLGPGETVATAQRDLEAVTARVREREPEQAGIGVRVVSRVEEVVGETRPVLLLLLGAAGLVLAIACVNVVNLLLVRAAARRRELAVRAALGAGRGRLLQTLMCETVLLACMGGAAGAALAVIVLPVVVAQLPATLPRTVEIAPDGRVLGFALAVTLLTAVLAGFGPAWSGARAGLAGVLRDEARGVVAGKSAGRAQSVLVTCEVALAFLLLGATGLLGRSLTRLLDVDPGFERAGLVVAELYLPERRYADAAATLAFAERVRAAVRALPGVVAVAVAEDAPFASGHSAGDVAIQAPRGSGADIETNVDQAVVSDDYASALGVPLLEGRFFSPADRAGAEPVAVVSRAMARRYWPGGSAIGARIRDGGSDSAQPWRTVVGVIGDVRHTGLSTEPAPKLYMPLAQHDRAADTQILLVRANPAGMAALGALTGLIAGIDPEVPVARIARMRDLVSSSTTVVRFRVLLIGVLAALAGALAIAGLYGVMAFTVARRTAEIGVRVALGARPARIVRDVLLRGLRLAATGIALGLVAGLLAFRMLDRFLFRVAPNDPATLLGIALLLLATTAAAAWIPGRRASRIDPLEALRRR
jgi:predicted permease